MKRIFNAVTAVGIAIIMGMSSAGVASADATLSNEAFSLVQTYKSQSGKGELKQLAQLSAYSQDWANKLAKTDSGYSQSPDLPVNQRPSGSYGYGQVAGAGTTVSAAVDGIKQKANGNATMLTTEFNNAGAGVAVGASGKSYVVISYLAIKAPVAPVVVPKPVVQPPAPVTPAVPVAPVVVPEPVVQEEAPVIPEPVDVPKPVATKAPNPSATQTPKSTPKPTEMSADTNTTKPSAEATESPTVAPKSDAELLAAEQSAKKIQETQRTILRTGTVGFGGIATLSLGFLLIVKQRKFEED